MRHSTIIGLFMILSISLLFFTGALCQDGQGAQPTSTQTPTVNVQPTATPTIVITASPQPTGTSLPTGTPNWSGPWPGPTATLGPEGCVPDRDAIQDAIYAYNWSHGKWPTADGEPGDIAWAKLVKEYLPYMPHTNDECNWQVNSHPEGQVCVPLENLC